MHYKDLLLEIDSEQAFVTQTVSTPGKLYIAGEYAILEPGQAAILVALDAYLSCTVSLATDNLSGTLQSTTIQNEPFNYTRSTHNQPGLMPSAMWPRHWAYVLSAIETVERLLVELNLPLQNYHIQYETDLEAENGRKYGLGSSGAVTVSTIRALLRFYGYSANPLIIYKLAAIASLKVSTKGSFGDLAASAYGGWIYYQSPDRQGLAEQIKATPSLTQLLAKDWPQLAISHLTVPHSVDLVIGWTDAPASTDELVHRYQQHRDTESDLYQQFLANSQATVQQLAQDLENGDVALIQKGIAKARHLLRKMTRHWQLPLETNHLTQLIEIAQSYQYEAKSSGAGGGDCGIAIGSAYSNRQGLIDSWKVANIIPLPYQVSPPLTESK
ncbi:phosphomevalonate kinase [Globicatella sanguinis]